MQAASQETRFCHFIALEITAQTVFDGHLIQCPLNRNYATLHEYLLYKNNHCFQIVKNSSAGSLTEAGLTISACSLILQHYCIVISHKNEKTAGY